MSGVEVLGAFAASIQLIGLAGKAVKLFFEMSRGFEDANGEAALIHEELSSFKQSAKFASENLKRLRVDDLGLEQSIWRYQGSITKLVLKMEAIESRKKLIGQTRMWMELMSTDSEVTKLRGTLRRHTRELAANFTLSMLDETWRDGKKTRRDGEMTQRDGKKTRKYVEERKTAQFDFIRSTRQDRESERQDRESMREELESFRLQHQASDEKINQKIDMMWGGIKRRQTRYTHPRKEARRRHFPRSNERWDHFAQAGRVAFPLEWR
jgi:hypothetical protein